MLRSFSYKAPRRCFVAGLALAALTPFLAGTADAAPYTFATFNVPTDGSPFSFTNNGGTSGTISSINVPVTFNFTSGTGLGNQDRAGFLNISPVVPPSTTQPALVAGSLVDQPINQLEKLTISSGAGGAGSNFLTLFFTGDITGFLGGNSAALSGSDNNPSNPRIVAYTSDFGTFTAPGNSYNLNLTSVAPVLSIGPGGFLNSFVADIGGQFSGNFITAVPAPTSLIMYGTGLAATAVLARFRRRRAAR